MKLQSVKQRFGIIGQSSALNNALNTAVRVAPTDLTVLIMGQSGVGKEVFSKIIHALSPRKHNKFIAINCGAIPAGTINSELFGHEKGSFTGAAGDRKGYFETVDKGTIFLDEIGEMPLDTQAHLLRILESGEFMRVGSSKVYKTDVRVVAATNAALEDKIKKGKFREDLFYRLNTVPIRVPSLAERREDIYLLFRKFAVDFAEKYRSEHIQLDENAQQILKNYPWPGNIRELKNIAEQVSVLAPNRRVSGDDLLEFIPKNVRRNLPMVTDKKGEEKFQEREILYKLLFDMKSDLNDLKSLVFELIRNNDLRVPDLKRISQLSAPDPRKQRDEYPIYSPNIKEFPDTPTRTTPVILEENKGYNSVVEVEESLSLEEMERGLIQKALKKHKSKRKDAASELGISERTLYRKIKYYNIKE